MRDVRSGGGLPQEKGMLVVGENSPDSTAKMRVLLVDDQKLVRFTLRAALSSQDDFEVVGEAEDGEQALALCEQLHPDLVIMDIEMPKMDGLSATRLLKQTMPETSVLILTSHDNADYLLEAVATGVSGYVLKGKTVTSIVQSIRDVMAGEPVLDANMSFALLERIASHRRWSGSGTSAREGETTVSVPVLTNEESRALSAMAEGKAIREIAEELGVSYAVSRDHVHSVVSKMEVSDRTQAVVKAARMGLIGTAWAT